MNPSIGKSTLGILLIASGSLHAAQVGSPCDGKKAPLSVHLAAEKYSLSSGQPIGLRVLLTNTGIETVSLPPFMGIKHYWLQFDVVDEQGKTLAWLGPELKMRMTDERVALYPGYLWGTRIDGFEGRYAMTRPGTYTVRAIYGVGPDGSCPAGRHESNPIRLVIAE